MEKLFGSKTLDQAISAQTDYAKSAYEGFVAQFHVLAAAAEVLDQIAQATDNDTVFEIIGEVKKNAHRGLFEVVAQIREGRGGVHGFGHNALLTHSALA